MGRSVNGQLAYGFYVDDDKRWEELDDPPPLPWEDSDMDDWWLKISDFDSGPYPYEDDGDALREGFTDEDATEYFRRRREWANQNPPPWTYEFFGSVYSEWTDFFAVRGAPQINSYWSAEPVDLSTLTLDADAERLATELQQLMASHGVTMTPMGWYLLAYEG